MSAPTCGVSSAGTKLEYSTNAGSTWTQISGLRSTTPPKRTRSAIKAGGVSNTNNTNGYCPGKIDMGTSPFVADLTDAQHTALDTLCGAGTSVLWRWTFPSGKGIKCTGFLKECGFGEVNDDDENVLTSEVVIQFDDAPTLF